MVVAGLDGCRAGWLMVRLDTSDRSVTIEVASAWRDLSFDRVAIAAVDMPIGLADRGRRACDLAARALLPAGRKSSVFAAPRRYMLECPDWRSAQTLGRRLEDVGLSKQSWNLLPKIAEIDRAIVPADQVRLREAHPELIFHHWNAWRPLPSKKLREGLRLRHSLLARAGLSAPDVATLFPRRVAGPDDLLDGAACALIAERISTGRARRLPQDPPCDKRGLRMEIWY